MDADGCFVCETEVVGCVGVLNECEIVVFWCFGGN